MRHKPSCRQTCQKQSFLTHLRSSYVIHMMQRLYNVDGVLKLSATLCYVASAFSTQLILFYSVSDCLTESS